MIFSIYKGKEDDQGEGNFTNGHLYLAEPEVNESSVIETDRMKVKDDNQESIWIKPDNGRFEYPEEVYGVIIKTLTSRHPGEVVVITDVQDDFVEVKGMGFIRAEHVQLLDFTIVRPGMMVYDRSKTRWDRIRRVDECLRLRLEGDDEMRECTDFVFAVSDGDLSSVPLLRCLDDTGRDNINKDSIYRAVGLDDNGLLLVEDDSGQALAFEPERFEFI